MSSSARKILQSFEKLAPKDRRAVAAEILRRVADDGLEDELLASASAVFQELDQEESQGAKR